MKWKDKLINYIIEQLKDDLIWKDTIEKILTDYNIGIHLAIFNEPFLALVLSGEKKIESRFSINKICPYKKIKTGDIVILKLSGGLVVGIFVAGEVKFFDKLDQSILNTIENEYGELICTKYDEKFWEARNKANYVSLIEISSVKELLPFKCEKKDRSGWSVLREGISKDLFSKIK